MKRATPLSAPSGGPDHFLRPANISSHPISAALPGARAVAAARRRSTRSILKPRLLKPAASAAAAPRAVQLDRIRAPRREPRPTRSGQRRDRRGRGSARRAAGGRARALPAGARRWRLARALEAARGPLTGQNLGTEAIGGFAPELEAAVCCCCMEAFRTPPNTRDETRACRSAYSDAGRLHRRWSRC